MITLTKEIKAFTVLENTPATFKMEVEINTVTNINITVDRTNNNKVTATNKQGERIIVLPYLVIEAKQLADDNKPKINLTKTNFDYHKYGKKQVLTNDENNGFDLREYTNKITQKISNMTKVEVNEAIERIAPLLSKLEKPSTEKTKMFVEINMLWRKQNTINQ